VSASYTRESALRERLAFLEAVRDVLQAARKLIDHFGHEQDGGTLPDEWTNRG
jgi:hypothetical protein